MLTFTIAKHFAFGQIGDNMVEQQLDNFMVEEGYTKIPSNLPEFTIYFHMENNYVNVFHIIDYQKNLYITEDQYQHIREKIKELFLEKGIENVHILSLIICGNVEKVRGLCKADTFCWILDPYNDRLIIYENQVNDFYGMKSKLEYFLSHLPSELQEQHNYNKDSRTSYERHGILTGKIPYVTASLVLINVIAFIICTFTGDMLYNIGAYSAGDFAEGREYYRILTSIFLHWDVNHLVSNMIVLYYLGEVVEKHLGSILYGIVYMVTGICGNIFSYIYEIYTDSHIVSVGASGAVFGIIGALLILVIVNKGHLEQITTGRLLFMISYSLYSGFMGSDINNAAHIGGFISGMAAALILWTVEKRHDKKKLHRNGERYEN